MKKVPIYIFDSSAKKKIQALIDENETLGFEKNIISNKNNHDYQLVDFPFDENTLIGYWVDPDKDDDTGTYDIVFYCLGTSFRTPYSEELKDFFNFVLLNKCK